MSNEKSDSCIDFVADMPAGSHFNIFYESTDELVDVLVSFIKAGLENNDFCAWRLFDPLINVDWARRILKNAGIDADAYISSGQLEIVLYNQWLESDGKYNFARITREFENMYGRAILNGFNNVRLTGDSSLINDETWPQFINYEKEANDIVANAKMIALCTYSLSGCSKSQIFDAIGNHEGTIIKKDGHWTIMKDIFKKRYEKNMENMKNYLDTVVKMSCDGIFVLDNDLRFEFCNDACVDILGWSEKELMGESLMKLMSSEHYASFLQRWDDAQRGETEPYEISIVRNDGTGRTLIISHAQMDYDGVQKHSCIVKDVTRDIGDYIRMIRGDITGYSNSESAVSS